MAEWSAHEGDADRADTWYRHAAASADRRGVPSEIVAVAEAYAPVLLAAGHREAAATIVGRVASWSAHDFDCALLQLRLFHALDEREPWFNALRQTQSLAGEREIPQALLTLPEPRAGDAAPHRHLSASRTRFAASFVARLERAWNARGARFPESRPPTPHRSGDLPMRFPPSSAVRSPIAALAAAAPASRSP